MKIPNKSKRYLESQNPEDQSERRAKITDWQRYRLKMDSLNDFYYEQALMLAKQQGA